jgi:flagellar biosynthesis GTPase FlhF
VSARRGATSSRCTVRPSLPSPPSLSPPSPVLATQRSHLSRPHSPLSRLVAGSPLSRAATIQVLRLHHVLVCVRKGTKRIKRRKKEKEKEKEKKEKKREEREEKRRKEKKREEKRRKEKKGEERRRKEKKGEERRRKEKKGEERRRKEKKGEERRERDGHHSMFPTSLKKVFLKYLPLGNKQDRSRLHFSEFVPFAGAQQAS